MTSAPVPLIRRFQAIPEAYQTQDLSLEDVYLGAFEGALRNWRDLEAEHRAVVLADAGAVAKALARPATAGVTLDVTGRCGRPPPGLRREA